MKKKLSINYPIITSYTHHAHLLAILSVQPKAKEWIFSNYIQLYINKNLVVNNWADFYFPLPYEIKPIDTCKWISSQKISEIYIDRHYNDIVDYIEESINDEYYIHMMINYKYIFNSRFYKKNKDRRHDVLIYGYDKEKGTIYCADFMFNSNKYTFVECTYDELRNSYNNDYVKHEMSYLEHNIMAYKLNETFAYGDVVDNIIYWLKRYADGECPEYWGGINSGNRGNIEWGINYYNALCQYLKSIHEERLDIRFFHLLKDHKKMMFERMVFLNSCERVSEKYISLFEDLYVRMKTVENLVIKYNITKNNNLIDEISNWLVQLRKTEIELLTDIIIELEKTRDVNA